MSFVGEFWSCVSVPTKYDPSFGTRSVSPEIVRDTKVENTYSFKISTSPILVRADFSQRVQILSKHSRNPFFTVSFSSTSDVFWAFFVLENQQFWCLCAMLGNRWKLGRRGQVSKVGSDRKKAFFFFCRESREPGAIGCPLRLWSSSSPTAIPQSTRLFEGL